MTAPNLGTALCQSDHAGPEWAVALLAMTDTASGARVNAVCEPCLMEWMLVWVEEQARGVADAWELRPLAVGGGATATTKSPSKSTSRPGRTRVRVTLAEAPTDVLAWLAQHPGEPFQVAQIAREVAPADADSPLTSTRAALYLLRDCGYVVERLEDGRWEATAEGRAAIVEAMARVTGGGRG